MSARRTGLAACLMALGLTLLPAASAPAAFSPFTLASKTVTQQADSATAPILSADGRYVAFAATNFLEGQTGLFREDLQTGEIVAVASGAAIPPKSPGSDATAPSISADGRYVSFTTAAALDPIDDTVAGSRDVYVADMSVTPPSYELTSIAPGSTEAMGAATVAPRVALSGDGRKVAFVDAGQVYLRDLDRSETTLVSVRRDPQSGQPEPGVAVPGGGAIELNGLGSLTGASLSADGTTVAWLGAHLPEQVPLLADEKTAIEALDTHGNEPYDEPLWRRVGNGPLAPTRRIVGGGDPLAPGCPGTTGTLAEPACRGPFPGITHKEESINLASGWLGVGGIDGVPQLSADGHTVALIGNPTEATNVFEVNMAAGLSRLQAVRQLTAQIPVPAPEGSNINRDPYVPLNGYVYALAMTPDGQKIAFTTARQRFPLAPPNLVGPLPSQLGLVELYLIDLETESLQRVTHGLGGEGEASRPSTTSETGKNGNGAASPSFGRDGRLIAFSSTASNLVAGDGNSAGGNPSDVFLTEDLSRPSEPGGVRISPPPSNGVKPGRRLALRAYSLPDGAVKVVAVAPRAGRLQALAEAAPQAGQSTTPLARDRARAKAEKPVAMILVASRRYRRLVYSRQGLPATVWVSFKPRSGRPLRRRLRIRFQVHRSERGSGG